MRIAFETSNVIGENPTGVAIYIKNFVQAIFDANRKNELKVLYKADRIKYKKTWNPSANIASQTYLASIYPLFKNTDILHGLDTYIPNWKGCKKIVTFHDILPLLYTDSEITPKNFRIKKEKDYKKAVEIADLIITVSENTKTDLLDYFQLPESKVTSVYPGLDSKFFKKQNKNLVQKSLEKFGIEKDYLLFIGTISGRKNTAGLVEAFARSDAKKDFQLILAGSISYMGENTLEAIEKHKLGDKVKILGYVENRELPMLYSGASGFLFPTFYEGFGFPILEAMLCETPVLTSNIGSAQEISNGFSVSVNPNDIDSITQGINELIGKDDLDFIGARKHAKEFTWKKTAEKTLKIYESIL